MANTDTLAFLRRVHPDEDDFALTRIPKAGGNPTLTRERDPAAWIATYNTEHNCYFNPGILRPGFEGNKPKEGDVLGSRWLWIELDPVAKDRADLDVLRDECMKLIMQLDPAPTMPVYSGRGCWAWWELDQVVEAGEVKMMNIGLTLQARRAARRLGLDKAVEVDSVFNPDRLARLVGSVNHKTGREAEVISDSRVTYSPEQFVRATEDDIASDGRPGRPKGGGKKYELPALERVPVSLDDLPTDHLRELAQQGNDEKEDRSDALFAFLCEGVRQLVDDEVLYSVILDRDIPVSDHVLFLKKGKPRSNPTRYARRQIEQAHEQVRIDEAGLDMLPFSEDHLAWKLVEDYGENLLHCNEAGGWYEWDDERWAQEKTLRVFDLARGVCRWASAATGATALASSKSVAAVQTLARSDRRVAIPVDVFDADPMVLNTPEGLVDLRTGELSGQAKEQYCTKITRVGPHAGTPKGWLEFLKTVTGGDDEYIAYLRRVMGYCLTGQTVEHALFFAHGRGGNGKSVLQEVLLHILGDYGRTTSFNTLVVQPGGSAQHPTDLAALRGARLVVAPETEANQRWAEAKIKQMTGGDTIAARFMRQDFFEYVPQFKLFVVGNHRPEFTAVDDAIRRRVHLLPFDVQIANPDKHYKERVLLPEAGKILSWAIEGCIEWQAREGLDPPEKVRDASGDYLDEQDTLGQWLEACTVRKGDGEARFKLLYESYTWWCREHHERVPTATAFGSLLNDRGIPRAGRGGTQKGIRVGIVLTDLEADRLRAVEATRRADTEIKRRIARNVGAETFAEGLGRGGQEAQEGDDDCPF